MPLSAYACQHTWQLADNAATSLAIAATSSGTMDTWSNSRQNTAQRTTQPGVTSARLAVLERSQQQTWCSKPLVKTTYAVPGIANTPVVPRAQQATHLAYGPADLVQLGAQEGNVAVFNLAAQDLITHND